MSAWTGIVCVNSILFLAGAASAQEAGQAGVIVYPPSFFTAYQPNSANDMVGRVPGFTVNQGDANVRGLSGAAGNVLVDGERPTSKAVSVTDILSRIPPSMVERIELIRGGAAGIDMQGQAVVVNVVRKKEASVSREVEVWTKLYTDHDPAEIGYLRGSRTGPALTLEGTVQVRQEAHYDSGDGRLTRRNGAGGLISEGPFRSRVDNELIEASGAAEYRAGPNTFRLNLGVSWVDLPRTEEGDLTSAAGVAIPERSRGISENDRGEVGLDFSRRLDGGRRLRLMGLHTAKKNVIESRLLTPTTDQISGKEGRAGETLTRASIDGFSLFGFSVETGAEAALNTLDSRSSLTVGGVPVAVPSANVEVEERRAEGYVTGNRKLSGALSLEARLKVESSEISQSGDADHSENFVFAKPRVVLTWAPNAGMQVRLRAERLVGQLNFEDFAATGDLLSGSVNAGNANLVPERFWIGEVAAERRFWGSGALVLTLSHSQIEEAIDLIPIQNAFDAPGNIGDGWRREAKVDFSAPLDRFGLADARLIANAAWRTSEVTDPVTGLLRHISRERPFEGMITFTQNLPKLKSSYTFQVNTFGWQETSYRLSEVRVDEDAYQLKFYWDVRPQPGLNIRLQLENAIGKEKRRTRTLYTGPRSAEVVRQTEHRSYLFDPFIMIRVRKAL